METELTQAAVEHEIRRAELEERPANFRGKTISNFMLLEKEVGVGLDLENAIITGSMSLANTEISGDFSLKNVQLGGPIYMGSSKI